MAMFSIPKEHQRVIADLARLSSTERSDLLNVLRNIKPSLDADHLVEQISESLSLSEERIKGIISLIYSLYSVADYLERTPDQIAADVLETIKAADSGELSELTEDAQAAVQEFVYEALTLYNSLGISAKALRLARQHERIFLRAEIYTDLRPVFRIDDPEVRPAAAVLTHTLKLEYLQDGDNRTVFIALDNQDLAQLQETLDRAAKKHKALCAAFENSEVMILELEKGR